MGESVFELLRKRYPAPAWAFLEDVRNGTGAGRVTRTADALAMSLYPSRGLHLHGFEVKVSRPDWLTELKNPDKAEEIARFCHFWWLVISDPTIVRSGELPATWGLLVSNGTTLQVEREPTINGEAKEPTHRFLGSILRKVCSTSTDEVRLARARSEGLEEGIQIGEERATKRTEDGRAQRELERLEARIEEFEKVSGVRIDGWNLGNLGQAVRLLTNGTGGPLRGLETMVEYFDRIGKDAKEALQFARTVMPKVVS